MSAGQLMALEFASCVKLGVETPLAQEVLDIWQRQYYQLRVSHSANRRRRPSRDWLIISAAAN